ncbi:MAG: 5-formyltetrahydrofolate cyclo-ligase [Cellvibrionaceae bacterium]
MKKNNNVSLTIQEKRKAIRKESRNRRRSLTIKEQAFAALTLQKIIQRQPFFLRSHTFAYYLSNDNEIDPSLLASQSNQRDKKFFLPVLQPLNLGKLWFLFHDVKNTGKHSSMKLNRYGILEPRLAGKPIPNYALDVVFMPLVAFDKTGARLGMGGGFYDRSFSFKKNKRANKPLLIGLAHHCQEWNALPVESWDIPLDAIITDRGIFSTGKNTENWAQRDFLKNDMI